MRHKKRPALARPLPVSDVLLEGILGRRGKDLMATYQIQKAWTHLVGEGVAEGSIPKRIQSDTLHVSVANPVWAHQLSMMKDLILTKIQNEVGVTLRDIRFQVSG